MDYVLFFSGLCCRIFVFLFFFSVLIVSVLFCVLFVTICWVWNKIRGLEKFFFLHLFCGSS